MAKKKQIRKLKKSHKVYVLFGILVVLMLVFGFLILPKSHAPVTLTNTQIAQMINNGTVTVPDFTTQVKLTNGEGVPDSTGSGYINVTQPYYSVKTPTGHDIFAVMNFNLGGSGVFANVALFKEENGVVEYKNSYPVGDRVPITQISGPSESNSEEYEITIQYLGRTESQNMSDTPSISKTITAKVKNSEFINVPSDY